WRRPSPQLRWWNQNWRTGGLQERRNFLIKSCALYNQTWCGCEFSSHK
ncbi:MAG: epoxyqueuosine reductase QueH, partial [Bacteroidales bacterium]|nr:epoxyqueuosine reductase QueH [Bacteroidales bacterium]